MGTFRPLALYLWCLTFDSVGPHASELSRLSPLTFGERRELSFTLSGFIHLWHTHIFSSWQAGSIAPPPGNNIIVKFSSFSSFCWEAWSQAPQWSTWWAQAELVFQRNILPNRCTRSQTPTGLPRREPPSRQSSAHCRLGMRPTSRQKQPMR